jgi:hypothetical protein
MGYGYKITANELGRSENLWPIREYGLYRVFVRRESTVVDKMTCVTNSVMRYPGERPLNDDGSRALITMGA